MTVPQELVGREYPPEGVYVVSREKIREFALATYSGEVPAAHLDPQAAAVLGYADVVAPVTFAVIAAQRSDVRLIADPAAGIDFDRVVHGEESFVQHRPIVAGDELLVTLVVDGIRSAGGHSMVTTRNEITDVSGTPVATVLSTLVVRGPDA